MQPLLRPRPRLRRHEQASFNLHRQTIHRPVRLHLSQPRPRPTTSKTNITTRRLHLCPIFKKQTTRHRPQRLLRVIRQRNTKGKIKQFPLRPLLPTKSTQRHTKLSHRQRPHQRLLPITITTTNFHRTLPQNTNTTILHRPNGNRMFQSLHHYRITIRLPSYQITMWNRLSTRCTKIYTLLQTTNATRHPNVSAPKTIRTRRPRIDHT